MLVGLLMDSKKHTEGFSQEEIKDEHVQPKTPQLKYKPERHRTMFQTQPKGTKTPEVGKTCGVCYFNIDNKRIISYYYSKGQRWLQNPYECFWACSHLCHGLPHEKSQEERPGFWEIVFNLK